MVFAQCAYAGSSLRIRTETETGLSRSPLPVGIVNQIETKQVRLLRKYRFSSYRASGLGLPELIEVCLAFPTILFGVDIARQPLQTLIYGVSAVHTVRTFPVCFLP